MKYYSSKVIIYDNGTQVIKLFLHAKELDCLMSLSKAEKDEDGYFINYLRLGIPEHLTIDVFDPYIKAINPEETWIEIDSDHFFSWVVFDQDSWYDWDLGTFVAGYDGNNQRIGNEIRIPDSDLFRTESLGLSQLLEDIFLSHGYNFVEDILDKLNQDLGKENILFILENDESLFQELMDNLREHKHLK